MLKLIGDGTFSLWLSALGGILVIAVVYWTVPYSKGYQAADQRHQAEYDQNAADYEARRKCERLATVKSAVACYDHASKTSRESHRAEQDLDAQREMAQWAESVLYATLATFAAAIAGVVFLWRDTRQNMKTGQAQTRAYLSIDFHAIGTIDPGSLPPFDLIINNSGASPALFVTRHIGFKIGSKNEPVITDTELPGQPFFSSIHAGGSRESRGSSDITISKEEYDEIERGEKAIYAWTIVWYSDVFGDRWCHRVWMKFCGEQDVRMGQFYVHYQDERKTETHKDIIGHQTT